MPDYFPKDEPIYRETSPLSIVRIRLTPDIDDEAYLPPATVNPRNDPGLRVLVPTLGPDLDDYPNYFDCAMTHPADAGQAEAAMSVVEGNASRIEATHGTLPHSESTAPAVAPKSTENASLSGDPEDLASRTKRIDSAQDHEEDVLKPSSGTPTTKKELSPTKDASKLTPRDSIADSPTLSKHLQAIDQDTSDRLPAVHTGSYGPDVSTSTTQAPSLPSIRPLTEFAQAAMQQDSRAAHQHSHSTSSTIPPSPISQYLPPSFHHASSHSTPSGYNTAYSGPSPVSTIGDLPHYSSPHTQMAGPAYFTDRRRSASTNNKPPPFLSAVPSLPSTSSSGESYSHASVSTDGYSTSQTTPIETAIANENNPRPILPPPPGMAITPIEGYRCDFPGCTAAPFQTQYLLSSHRNVHSSVRSHYCPVQGCPRSEGGKGFKRKNEMIRHGLVHSSPGYICPFCPDREHRYPRPDNLQRHVRVHHEDKDKDDPTLREVLAQRQEGDGKQRRRRTQGSVSSLNNDTAP